MSATVDEFCDVLRDRLNAIEQRFDSVKADMHSMPEQAEKPLRDKLDEIRSHLQAQKERIEQTRIDLKVRAHQKMVETKEAVSEWKAKRESRKLKARADRAEAYAADCIANALASIDEAEEAVLNAVLARIDADQAK